MKERTITFEVEEVRAAGPMMDYYLDTLTECSRHAEHEHGDETDCEGWGPAELADLRSFCDKVRKAY
jgi:hypothetical protein